MKLARVQGEERVAASAPAAVEAGVFSVEYVDEGGIRRHEPLPAVWTTRFEEMEPVRKVRSFHGQRSVVRDYWFARTGQVVSCESRLERDHAMLFDFDPLAVGLVSQPFRLFWPGQRGRRGHVPDFFVRLADGTTVLVDVRPDDQIEPGDAEAFAASARACELAGWSFRRVGVIAPVLLANVRWLAGYRHPRYWQPRTAAGLREVFAEPRCLFAGASAVGDRLAVLPVLYHLLWRRLLTADLSERPLGPDTLVGSAPEGGLAG
ncbi:TnsA-like heteromeric transposase endonuclease subunit [Kitasatospora mediocidica]|uniref:TnsA-like heteromeric transposase endonuclease subunit n=1 Tax=Kitasatospora mediocidica TaxID=58352 RepID=UPI001E4FE80B|nr:TnsA-like heteromeric transposase endonuclease subunit [Kitasatospora mediocidica]